MWKDDSRPALKSSLYALGLPDNSYAITFTNKKATKLPCPTPQQEELILLLDGSRRVSEIADILQKKGINWTIDEVKKELDVLYDKYLLEDNKLLSSFSPNPRYERQLAFFSAHARNGIEYANSSQQKLEEARVVIFGLGGFGSNVFYGLSYIGIGSITGVDFDKVDISNLNRQILYFEKDVGKLKTEVAKERAGQLNSSIEYKFINQKIESSEDFEEILEDHDLGILVADSPREKVFGWMNEASSKTGTPALFMHGAGNESIHVGPLYIPGKTVCYDCSRPDFPFHYNGKIIEFINGRQRQGVIYPYVSTAAGLMVNEVIKHFTGYKPCQLYNQCISINLVDYDVIKRKLKAKEDCPYCRGHGDASEK